MKQGEGTSIVYIHIVLPKKQPKYQRVFNFKNICDINMHLCDKHFNKKFIINK